MSGILFFIFASCEPLISPWLHVFCHKEKYHKNYVLKREMYFIYLGMGLVVEDASPGNPQQTATVTSSILRPYNRCECTRTENLHLFHPNSHQSTQ